MKHRVCIINSNPQYDEMFEVQGWEVIPENRLAFESVDLIQFTGGEDVDPSLYGERKMSSTYSNLPRDKHEGLIFSDHLGVVPMAGICRGGQFLNVKCGGRMWQAVDGHAISGVHPVFDVTRNKIVWCTSTHHQMMVAGPNGEVIGEAEEALIKRGPNGLDPAPLSTPDTEVVIYKDEQCLCFQPHPEFRNAPSDCTDYYFYLLNYYFNL